MTGDGEPDPTIRDGYYWVQDPSGAWHRGARVPKPLAQTAFLTVILIVAAVIVVVMVVAIASA